MNQVKEYYANYGIKEWKRLMKDSFNKLEFLTTMRYLKKKLPKKGRILDAGGGPGRYTIELAKRGYNVTLLDYTPELLKIALKKIKQAKVEKKVEAIIEGDLRNLSVFRDNSFDVVLCLGAPLSHLIAKSDRIKAVKELKRVAKKGAPIFISVIGVLALVQTAIWKFPDEVKTSFFRRYLYTGDYFGGHGFTTSHFFRADELEKLVKSCGLKVIAKVGLEGLASGNEVHFSKNFNRKDRWNHWLRMHYKTCEYPSVVDTSQHILIVARK